MDSKKSKYPNGKEEYSLVTGLTWLLVFIVYIGLSTLFLWPLTWHQIPIVALIYLLVSLGSLITLIAVACPRCYYYGRVCPLLVGKISSYIFKRKEGFGNITYIMSFLATIVAFVPMIGGFFTYGFWNLALVVYFLVATSLLVYFPCNKCKMRKKCALGRYCPLCSE